MANIIEDYCSFELSKLLKEKGFDELCIMKYTPDGRLVLAGAKIQEWQNSELEEDEYIACTHQMACKWLREKHKIHLIAEPCLGEGDEENLCFDRWFWTILKEEGEYKPIRRIDEFESYELAISDAINYCLEHLI